MLVGQKVEKWIYSYVSIPCPGVATGKDWPESLAQQLFQYSWLGEKFLKAFTFFSSGLNDFFFQVKYLCQRMF